MVKAPLYSDSSILYQILDASPSFIAYIDRDEKYVFVNKRYEIFFGKPRSEIQGRHVSSIIGQDAFVVSKPYFLKALSGQAGAVENKVIGVDRETLYTEVQFVPLIKMSQVEGVVVIAHDITERRNREKDQELLAKLSQIYMEGLNESEVVEQALTLLKDRIEATGVWLAEIHFEGATVDIKYEDQEGILLHGKIVHLDDYGKELRKAYLQGEVVVVNDVSQDHRTCHDVASFKNVKIESFITIPLRRNGKLKSIISFAKNYPYAWSAAEKTLIQSVSESLWTNIENKRLLSELRESIKARDQLISVCSHELKTPMSSLKLMYQMFEREVLNDDPKLNTKDLILKRIQMSNFQIQRMTKLIEDMLDVSKISSGHLILNTSKIDLVDLAEKVLQTLHDQLFNFQIPIIVKACDSLFVNADPFRIEQVIINLLTNAMKYGGTHPIELILRKQEHSAILQVVDKGIGIDKKNFERIFKRYERIVDTRGIGGIGLGLYISSQIIEAHKGKIWVDSEIGKGSTFTVELPLL